MNRGKDEGKVEYGFLGKNTALLRLAKRWGTKRTCTTIHDEEALARGKALGGKRNQGKQWG